jgi:hypothetical protein
VLLGTLLGCHGIPSADDFAPDDDEQGIVVSLRTLDGELVEPSEVQLGGASVAVPDSAGFVYFFGVPPGRTPVSAAAPNDEGPTYGHANVAPTELVASRLVPLPLSWTDGADATLGVTLAEEGVSVDVPAGALGLDGLPAIGAFRLGWGVPGAGDMATIPGDHLGQHDDVDVHPITLDTAFVVQAEDLDGEPLRLLDGTRLTVTVPLPVHSPLFTADEPRVYSWVHSRGYWVHAAYPVIDAVARTATFEAATFGWFGFGGDAGPLGCVVGRITDGAGTALTGLEVRLEQEGAAAPDRANTVNGSFCLVASPGTAATLSAVGYASDRSQLFTWSGEATVGDAGTCGGPACSDLGNVSADTWPDADEDRTFSGPGGDCDDHDRLVNPSSVFGDGSYCGGPL